MLIDWFTVGAQALNFVILVWLLKRLLYKPVLDAIDAREQHIAARLAAAAALDAKAIAQREAFEQKSEALDRQRADLLSQAEQDAKAQREHLLAQARQEADDLSARRRQALRSEAQRLQQQLGERAQGEVLAIARQVLSDLASATLEEQMSDLLVDRLDTLDDQTLAALMSGLTSDSKVIVRSAFELQPVQRTSIEAALNGRVGERRAAPLEFEFMTAPALVGGIELVAGGMKVAWSISQYLKSLENAVDELVLSDDFVADAGGDDHGASDRRP